MYDIIINPSSRSGLGIKVWNSIEPVLKNRNITYKTYFTEKPGDASLFAENITSTAEEHKILVLGGDGTINEILQGIVNFEHTTIGYIPSGSSNDLARDLNISSKPLERIEQILREETVVLKDVGELCYNSYETKDMMVSPETFRTTRRFSISAGIGFDAAVCAEASRSRAKSFFNKLGLGKLVYLMIALKQLVMSKREGCELTIDDNPPVKYEHQLFIAAMIHRYEGGGFMFCPHSSYNDGILDLCVAGNIPLFKILIILPTAFFGKHFCFKEVYELRGRNIHIKTDVPLWVHTDGEVEVKTTDISICCDKYHVKFIL